MNKTVITPGCRITLHFSLSLENGDVVDSTFTNKPVSLTLGDGNLPEGFESCLPGLVEGENKIFDVPPEKAFGMPNPQNSQRLPKDNFSDIQLEEGLVIGFTAPEGGELPGVVKEIGDSHVVIDFNHPLAGHTLKFQVEIIEVLPAEPATAETIQPASAGETVNAD
ncbi:FKBP-type peptidyl-prolyl cis-trans isomerase [Endozoicomonadaceae bacterium StTr2]